MNRPSMPINPAEWQEAVDVAYGLQVLESCRLYGLVTGGPAVNSERCAMILRSGKLLGYEPSQNAVENLAASFS